METLPVLRAAFETTGSGRWLMQTIVGHAFDVANGFRLELALSDDGVKGGLQATEAKLVAGEIDFIDTDWLSIARCRQAGLPITGAVPYGAIFGGLIAPASGAVRALADMPGKTIGVVRRLDKNWLLLRAACKLSEGFDPEWVCRVVETGSKTTLRERLCNGELDAALLFWHQVPELVEGGEFREVCDMLELLPVLGVRNVPSTFFVFHDALIAANPALVQGFSSALRAAHEVLREDTAAWHQAIGRQTNSGAALRAKWLSRVKTDWQADMEHDLELLAYFLGTFLTATELNGLPEGTLSASLIQSEA